MNNRNTQQPNKLSPLLLSTMMLANLGDRFHKMVNGRTSGSPIPSMNIKNQRQKRKLIRQTA